MKHPDVADSRIMKPMETETNPDVSTITVQTGSEPMITDVSSKPSEHTDFMSTDVVVPNMDFLSPLSEELCKDTELIWMPKPDSVDEKSLTRKKRACYKLKYCYWGLCFGIWRPEEVKEKGKKLRLIVISVVALVVIVAVAITIAFYVAGKQAEDSIKTAWLPYKDESGQTSTPKITVTSREEKFEITGTGTAVFDFDKSLLVYRPDKMSKQACYLTAVNTSYLISPDKLKNIIGDKMITDVSSKQSKHTDFMSTDVVVPNMDFLSL